MKISSISLLFLVFISKTLLAGSHVPLKFNYQGEFKIVQFTDTHISMVGSSNLKSFEVIRSVLVTEKPDLVVLTGDIVTEPDPTEGYKRLDSLFTRNNIPWVVVFGNHESEHQLSRYSLARIVEKMQGCLNADVGEIQGNSNFMLPIMGSHQKTAAILFCIDSNAYSTLKPKVGGYGWFDYSQIEWYRKSSLANTLQNGGKPLPSLAFFHIPLPEYTQAFIQKSGKSVGVRNEDESCPEINSGMFTAMITCGDVMGTFVGHDHLNDYITVFHNIALAYGRVSKIMKDVEDPVAGGRIIILKEGKREFDTWIREFNGNKVLPCSYPSSFQH